MDTQTVFDQLVKIQSWPNVGLVFAVCIVAGYVWKFAKWSWFPNNAIPPVVILIGGTAMLLLAGEEPANISGRIWHTRQFIVGVVIGFLAWVSHALVISRIEDWMGAQVPAIGKLLSKPSQNGTPPSPPAPPPSTPTKPS